MNNQYTQDIQTNPNNNDSIENQTNLIQKNSTNKNIVIHIEEPKIQSSTNEDQEIKTKKTKKFVKLEKHENNYFNCIIQTLYMTPEIRNKVFSLEYKSNNDQITKLQRLFALLELSDQESISTEVSQISLGWNPNDKYPFSTLINRIENEYLLNFFRGIYIDNSSGEEKEFQNLDLDFENFKQFLDYSKKSNDTSIKEFPNLLNINIQDKQIKLGDIPTNLKFGNINYELYSYIINMPNNNDRYSYIKDYSIQNGSEQVWIKFDGQTIEPNLNFKDISEIVKSNAYKLFYRKIESIAFETINDENLKNWVNRSRLKYYYQLATYLLYYNGLFNGIYFHLIFENYNNNMLSFDCFYYPVLPRNYYWIKVNKNDIEFNNELNDHTIEFIHILVYKIKDSIDINNFKTINEYSIFNENDYKGNVTVNLDRKVSPVTIKLYDQIVDQKSYVDYLTIFDNQTIQCVTTKLNTTYKGENSTYPSNFEKGLKVRELVIDFTDIDYDQLNFNDDNCIEIYFKFKTISIYEKIKIEIDNNDEFAKKLTIEKSHKIDNLNKLEIEFNQDEVNVNLKESYNVGENSIAYFNYKYIKENQVDVEFDPKNKIKEKDYFIYGNSKSLFIKKEGNNNIFQLSIVYRHLLVNPKDGEKKDNYFLNGHLIDHAHTKINKNIKDKIISSTDESRNFYPEVTNFFNLKTSNKFKSDMGEKFRRILVDKKEVKMFMQLLDYPDDNYYYHSGFEEFKFIEYGKNYGQNDDLYLPKERYNSIFVKKIEKEYMIPFKTHIFTKNVVDMNNEFIDIYSIPYPVYEEYIKDNQNYLRITSYPAFKDYENYNGLESSFIEYKYKISSKIFDIYKLFYSNNNNKYYLNNNLNISGYEIKIFENINNIESLFLQNNKITSNEAKYLEIVIKNNNNLKEINLSHNPIGDNGMKIIKSGFENNISLTTLLLQNIGLTDNGIEHLNEILNKCPNLTEINLSHNPIGDNGMKIIKSGFENNISLTKLFLQNIRLTDNGVLHLNGILTNCHNLTEINLSQNPIRNNGMSILKFGFINHISLTKLFLQNIRLTNNGVLHLNKILNKCPNLTEINLSNIKDINDNINDIRLKGLGTLNQIFQQKTINVKIDKNITNDEVFDYIIEKQDKKNEMKTYKSKNKCIFYKNDGKKCNVDFKENRYSCGYHKSIWDDNKNEILKEKIKNNMNDKNITNDEVFDYIIKKQKDIIDDMNEYKSKNKCIFYNNNGSKCNARFKGDGYSCEKHKGKWDEYKKDIKNLKEEEIKNSNLSLIEV